MKIRICYLLAIALVSGCLTSTPIFAQNAYITNASSSIGLGSVSVIDTATNSVIGSPIAVGDQPTGVAISPDGSKVYITNVASDTVSVIATATNSVIGSPITVGSHPFGVAAAPDGSKVYVANFSSGTVSVIDAVTNTVAKTIPVGFAAEGVAVAPDGGKVYVASSSVGIVSVIATATDTVTAQLAVGNFPVGVAVTPDSSKVYVTQLTSGRVLVIDAASNGVIAAITVGAEPVGVAVSPDGSKVYVANSNSGTVSVIDTVTDSVIGSPITVGTRPFGVALTPDGSKVFVANQLSNTVSVISTVTNAVSPITDPSLHGPTAFGMFIQPSLRPVPFSWLSAELVITGGQRPAFTLNARFALGASSNGINPPSEPVTLRLGPYKAVVPAGSFRQLPRKLTVYGFSGTISAVSLAVDILSLGNNSYQFGAAATPVDLTEVPNPVAVSLSIGNDTGSTTTNAKKIP